ncbi:hypothetical protein ACHAPT_010572 [Fusarium lateritium]
MAPRSCDPTPAVGYALIVPPSSQQDNSAQSNMAQAMLEAYCPDGAPALDLDPADPSMPSQDQEDRNNRAREWGRRPVKDYKVVVLDEKNRDVNAPMFDPARYGFSALVGLHDRKLVFQTDFRPSARYVWWTTNVQDLEIKKSTRYWSTGSYIKRNQLLGLVEEHGQDLRGITMDDFDEEDENDGKHMPEYTAADILVHQTVESLRPVNEDEDEDEEDCEEDSEVE